MVTVLARPVGCSSVSRAKGGRQSFKIHLHFIQGERFVCTPSWKKSLDQISRLCHGQADTPSTSEGFVRYVSSILISKRLFFSTLHAVSTQNMLRKLVFIFSLCPGSFHHSFNPAGRELSVPGWLSPFKGCTLQLASLLSTGWTLLSFGLCLSSAHRGVSSCLLVVVLECMTFVLFGTGRACLEFGTGSCLLGSHKHCS